MNGNEEVSPDEINRNLESLDKWVDAFKDIILVSLGLVASYITLSSGGTIDTVLALLIVAGSIFSSLFLPYKIAITKRSILGMFSRYRAIELMVVIFISWLVPMGLIFLFPNILNYLPPQTSSQSVVSLLLLLLPFVASVFSGIFGIVVVLKVFQRIGVTEALLKRYEKYPWGSGSLAPLVVSQAVINTQLYLVQAAQLYNQSANLAISMYARSFGALVVLIILCCALAYYEPRQILTKKGEVLFGIIAIGVFLALWNPVLGFITSLIGVMILIWYSLSLPSLDIASMMKQEQLVTDDRKINRSLFDMKYGKRAKLLHYSRIVFLWGGLLGLMVLLIVEAQEDSMFYFICSIFVIGVALYIFEISLTTEISSKKWEYIRKCAEEGKEITAEGILEFLDINLASVASSHEDEEAT